ncbi:MAG: hypothetical protein WAU13_05845 [Albidovulum sp.]
MSSSQPNLAMQDVLSSIRRLVSEDQRTEPRRDRDIPDAQDEAANFDGKFVLTDALRVAEPVDPASNVADPLNSNAEGTENVAAEVWNDDDDASAMVEETSERNIGASLEDTIAELEAAVAGSDEAFEPDGSEVKRADLSSDGHEDVPEFSFAVDAAEGDLAVETGPESPDAGIGDVREGADSGKDVADDFHDDLASVEVAHDENDTSDMDTAPAVPRTQGLVRRLNFATEVEDESPHGQAGDAMPSPEERDGQTDDLASGSDISRAVHPDMLRELVADIIRQELQGALGERMTRNVRKLVRREINRALDIKDEPETGS